MAWTMVGPGLRDRCTYRENYRDKSLASPFFMCVAADRSRWLGRPWLLALPTMCCVFDVYRCACVCRPYPPILIVSRCSLHVALDSLSVSDCSISFFFNMLVFGTLMSVSQLTSVRVHMTLRCNKRYNICSTAS